jgi:hypothetical protein
LIETVIAIALMGVMLSIFTTTLLSTVMLRRGQYHTQAANYIQEELDTLRSLPFAELLTRTNGNFLGLARQRGPWQVVTVAGDGQNKRLKMATTPTALVHETGLAVLPGNYRTDFTLSAKIKVDSGSTAGWRAGLVFRYRDPENYYRFRFGSGGNALDKVYHGDITNLWSDNNTCSTSLPSGSCWNWQTLQATVSANQITLRRNGACLNSCNPITNATFATGDLAVISIDGAKLSADDVSVTENAATTTWNFESTAESAYPSDWQRISYLDLPSGSATLTIENYLSETALKKATATVSWNDGGNARSVTGSTVIGQ